MQGLAFKVLFVGGVVTEPAAPPIFEVRAPARDILKISRFSDFRNIRKSRSGARQFNFFDVLMRLYLSSSRFCVAVRPFPGAFGGFDFSLTFLIHV